MAMSFGEDASSDLGVWSASEAAGRGTASGSAPSPGMTGGVGSSRRAMGGATSDLLGVTFDSRPSTAETTNGAREARPVQPRVATTMAPGASASRRVPSMQ